MSNTATLTISPVTATENAMDDIIDAWHASDKTVALDDFPGFLQAQDAYFMAQYGHPY